MSLLSVISGKKFETFTSSTLRFLHKHPLSDTHCLGKRYDKVVPIVQGFRLPNAEADASQEQKCKLSVLSLVLFKPFRGLENLVGGSESCEEQVWIDCTQFVKEIMNNMKYFYSGQAKVKDQRGSALTAQGAEQVDSRNRVDDDDLFDYVGDLDGTFRGVIEQEASDRDLVRMWGMDEATDVILEISAVDPAACPTLAAPERRIACMIEIFKKKRMLQNTAEVLARDGFAEWPTEGPPAIDVMKKWVKSSDTDNVLRSSSPCSAILPRDTEVVELLDQGLLEANMEWHPVPSASVEPKLPKIFSTIRVGSRLYTLIELQHYAFKAITKALLTRWRRAEISDAVGTSLPDILSNGQRLMFLGGEGGTGKSRIVAAVQVFCESWGRQHSVIKTALTGKTATLIGGRTLAGFLLEIRKQRVCDTLADLDLIFINEVSMMRKYQHAQLDNRLRVARRVFGVPFGGVHVILVGDFLQLPPVGGEPIYKDPSQKTKVSPNELAGYRLWREFKDVVILTECVRFKRDPEWGRGCQMARLGEWTPEFVRLVSSRVITRESSLEESTPNTMDTFVTPDNASSVAINNLFVSTAAKLLPKGDYPVRVVANFKGKLNALQSSDIRKIMQLPDTKFGRLAPYLGLIIGMPIQVTQNIRASKMVANGTPGRLEAIIYHRGTTFRLVHDSTADMTVKVPNVPPSAVSVRIKRGATATAMAGCQDADIFPLFFDTKAYSPCNIALAGFVNGVPRSLSVRMEQFPLVCAVSSTVYKVQGDTLDNMIVTEWRSKGVFTNKREQPYLLMSRVTSRLAFATLAPLTSEIIWWARPPRAALDEEARLKRLSNSTIERLKSN